MTMKPYFSFACFMLLSLGRFGQVYVKGVNINELPEVKRIHLMTEEYFPLAGDNFLDLWLDYGQEDRFTPKMFKQNSNITDSLGVQKNFRTTGQLINFMENQGWQHYLTVAAGTEKNNEFRHFFRRKEP
ncbi:hypothetical protein CLV98_10320 [Dyadobacter jejuensis]|uniref:Uncharacterized protein n=1 Tax=Dyadobacter jejuensis TaxID=1082580 RepID=A0A316ALH9_9BACT|nr:hypothetical protein [Dyadobacter jejuensis]PWJ58655.1 hypothetical protein CLV98_10320 [Dyadobacter jejuensis]